MVRGVEAWIRRLATSELAINGDDCSSGDSEVVAGVGGGAAGGGGCVGVVGGMSGTNSLCASGSAIAQS